MCYSLMIKNVGQNNSMRADPRMVEEHSEE
jgi:hypothetical protein